MFENKKLFLSLLVFSGIVSANPVASLDNNDALLVKVHDIKPIKNERGMTTNCEFTTTIYNRSSNDISELVFELNWYDEAAKNTIEQEKSMDNSRMRSTKDFVSSDVRSSVNVPVLKKDTQKSVQSKINTDRCFMLLEDAKIDVKSCKSGGNSRKDSISCESLFSFISSKSPEYYTNFLAVTLDKQKEEDKKEQEKINKELDEVFEKIEENLQKTSRLLTTTFAQSASSSAATAVNIPDAPTKPVERTMPNSEDDKQPNTPSKRMPVDEKK